MSLVSLEKLLQHRSRAAIFHINYQNVILYRQLERSDLWHPCCRKRYLIVERRLTREQEGRCEIWNSQAESVRYKSSVT